MHRHMLIYHVGVPLAVFGVLLLLGASLGTALRVGMAAGCISMVVMMVTASRRHAHRSAASTAGQPDPSTGGGPSGQTVTR